MSDHLTLEALEVLQRLRFTREPIGKLSLRKLEDGTYEILNSKGEIVGFCGEAFLQAVTEAFPPRGGELDNKYNKYNKYNTKTKTHKTK